jgi:hypothetical protein
VGLSEAVELVRGEIEAGPFPVSDGWGWLYRAVDRVAPSGGTRRRVICGYFFPNRVERWRRGLAYRLLGVHHFGAVIPTGGIAIRRWTKTRMAPYTLEGTSLRAARAFYYRACVFEGLHLPFLISLVLLAGLRAAEGRWDLAVQDSIVNLAANVYPVMHHRRTRGRIVFLLERRALKAL